jgi:hypothetical protein
MREFKTAMIACASLIVLGVATWAIISVRQYLPLVGILLLIVLVVVVIAVCALAVDFVARRFMRYDFRAIDQYGTVGQRYGRIEQFAPSLAPRVERISIDERAVDGSLEELPELPALVAPVPTFRELLERGVIQRALNAGKMILGYESDTGELRYGSWFDLYSCGVGGVSGTGKSTTVRFLLFQAALASAKFIMIDPHIGDPEESLAYQFSLLPAGIHQIKPCDGSTKNVMRRIDWLNKELAHRKVAKVKTPFIIFCIDEFNEQMRNKEVRDELSELLLNIEQGGRKFGIFAMLIGQRWSAQDLGGADIRTSLSSKLAHRFSDEDQAKRFVGSKHGPSLLELETGHWLFFDTNGKARRMETPATFAEDGQVIAQILGESSPERTLKPRETTPEITEITPSKVIALGARNFRETSEEEPESSPESTDESSQMEELAVAIMRLQAQGKSKTDIMREIWGVNPGASESYRQAQEQYQEVMKYIVEQLGA